MEIKDVLLVAHQWLREQQWWSDEKYAIHSVRHDGPDWVVSHNSRGYAESGDDLEILVGWWGPLVVRSDGTVTQIESSFPRAKWRQVETIGELVEATIQELAAQLFDDEKRP